MAAQSRAAKAFSTNTGHEWKTPVALILSNMKALELIAGKTKYPD